MRANEDGQDVLLFDRLCRIARDACRHGPEMDAPNAAGAASRCRRLKVAPNYRSDIELLQSFREAGMADVSEEIVDFRVERPIPRS